MNGNRLLRVENDQRTYTETNHEWILFRQKDWSAVNVRPFGNFKDTEPSGQLRHIAQEYITGVNPVGNSLLSDTKSRDIPRRFPEGTSVRLSTSAPATCSGSIES